MSWYDADLFWPLLVLSQVSGVAFLSIMGYWIMKYNEGQFSWKTDSGLYSYHAFMFTLGMVFLFGEAMLLFKVPKRLNLKSHFVRKVLHGITQGLAVIFSIVGLKAIFLAKEIGNEEEFYSVHSWIGMTAAMFFFFQHGVAMFFYILSKVFSLRFMIRFTDLHKFFGYVVFAMAIASCLTGMDRWMKEFVTKYWKRPPEVLLSDFYALLMLLFGTVVAFIASRPPSKQSGRKNVAASNDIEKADVSIPLKETDEK